VQFINKNFKSTKIDVPVGSIILFSDNIIRQYPGRKNTYPILRLLLGWRFTKNLTSLNQNIDKLLERQEIIPSLDGTLSTIFTKHHIKYHRPDIITWLHKMIRPKFLDPSLQLINNQNISTDNSKKILESFQHMPSLAEIEDMGGPFGKMYPEYTLTETLLYKPQELTLPSTPTNTKPHVIEVDDEYEYEQEMKQKKKKPRIKINSNFYMIRDMMHIDGIKSISSALANATIDINTQDSNGDSLLMHAISMENPFIVAYLVDQGADPNLKNYQHITPLGFAKQLDNKYIVKILKN
jgi:hypothetical protein